MLPLDYRTLIGQKHVYDAISQALADAGHPPTLVQYYDPDDPILEIVGGWLRDCRSAAIHGEPFSYVPGLRPLQITHYPCTRPSFITGSGASASNIVASTLLSERISHPFINGTYTSIEGGNCLKVSLQEPDTLSPLRVAIIGLHSLWLSHQCALESGEEVFDPSLLKDISITQPLDYQTLQIIKQLRSGSPEHTTPFDPSKDYAAYIDSAIIYAKQQELVSRIICSDLCVNKVVFIEQSDFHIDLRCFALRSVFFMHSTQKTIDLMKRVKTELESHPTQQGLMPLSRINYYLENTSKLLIRELTDVEKRNKHELEKHGIEVVEICGALEKRDSTGVDLSFMNVAILSGNLIVNSDCPPEYNFLKEAFVSGILDRFPDQEMLFTEDITVFIDMPKQRGGFRCASTEIPLFIEASPEKFPWESVLEKTFMAINALTDHTDLKTLFITMHDLNITWATDLRKTVLSTYNERHPESLLPVDWDAAVESLDTIYPIHKDGLLQAFTQLASTLPPLPPPL